jgi:hypothetical protein
MFVAGLGEVQSIKLQTGSIMVTKTDIELCDDDGRVWQLRASTEKLALSWASDIELYTGVGDAVELDESDTDSDDESFIADTPEDADISMPPSPPPSPRHPDSDRVLPIGKDKIRMAYPQQTIQQQYPWVDVNPHAIQV